MRTITVAGVVAGLGVALAGCSAQRPDYLYVDVQAQPVRLALMKSFGHFDQHYEPVPISECAVYEAVKPGETDRPSYPEEIWRVVNVAPDVLVVEIAYGVVPRGFLQSYPAAKPPVVLRPGHHYVAECTGNTQGSNEFAMPEVPPSPARNPGER